MAHFTRTTPAPVVSGGYGAFRDHVRKDFRETCAYCLLAELFAAGEENFELDHFQPQKRFPALVNDFYNLRWACHPCNRIKWAKWPPDALAAQGQTFVDFCADDFATHFIENDDGSWTGLTPAAKYTIDQLRLNRRHLKSVRVLVRKLMTKGATPADVASGG